MKNISADNIEWIVNTYGDTLYRICLVILKNEGDAEDVVQDTIIKYIEKKPRLTDEEHLKAWLITVAKNKCRDLLRLRKRNSYISIDEAKEITDTPAENGIMDMLMNIPEKFSFVLMLYYVEEFKVDEIAGIIGKSSSAVKMRLQKGRKLLKEMYEKEASSNGI